MIADHRCRGGVLLRTDPVGAVHGDRGKNRPPGIPQGAMQQGQQNLIQLPIDIPGTEWCFGTTTGDDHEGALPGELSSPYRRVRPGGCESVTS
jgi:hypothetical protein